MDLRMFRSQQCKHWKSQSHSFHTHDWHLIPIPPLLPFKRCRHKRRGDLMPLHIAAICSHAEVPHWGNR